MQLFWHRRDLRTADNRGLAAAAESGEVVPVFCFDDVVLDHASPPRVAFLLDALAELRARYRDLGSDLLVRHGDPSAVLPDLAAEYDVRKTTVSSSAVSRKTESSEMTRDADGVSRTTPQNSESSEDVDRVVWNHDYSGLARERDEAVRAALGDEGVAHEQYHDAVFHEPGAIRTNAGDPYSVYTYFWKKWQDREKPEPVPEPAEEGLADVSGEALPTLADLGFAEPDADLPDAGTEAARERLEDFCADDIFRYEEARDYPVEAATSRLSQDLKFGTIGVREVYERTEDAMAEADGDEERASVEEYQSQLAWREFYAQVLYFNPDVVSQNYKEYANPIEWREDDAELAAWKRGETGYPIVDAGMRQLRKEAYMHNRVRMIVASFLTKDLLLDWREGYAHFREHLVDHDTANDNGGWQWASSTGTDAQPYFRIFNPTTQGERYDPDAEYITEYVPELQGVPSEKIHAWPELEDSERADLAPDYPDPIVDHSERREEAIAMFERARGDD